LSVTSTITFSASISTATTASSSSKFSSASEVSAFSEFSWFLLLDWRCLAVFQAYFFNSFIESFFEGTADVFSAESINAYCYGKLACDGTGDFSSLPFFCIMN
jgi:hypothetical protein